MQGRCENAPLTLLKSMTILERLSAVPDLNQVYYRMGFKPKREAIPENLLPLVNEAISLGQRLCAPLAMFALYPLNANAPDQLELEGAFRIQSKKVFQWMEGCNAMYLAAVTIGRQLDQMVAQLSESGEMTKAFLLNAYGAEAAEALMESLDAHLKREATQHRWTTTKRFSPGYGDWDLTSQRELITTLQAERIGITLTGQCLMIPEKSVSAIMGIKT